MTQLQEQIITIYSVPFYALIIGVEILISHLHHTRSYTLKDTVHNFTLSMLTGAADMMMRAFSFVILGFIFGFHLFTLSHSVFYWVWLLLGVDFMHYLLHRLSHDCRLFWAVHVNHHSSQQFNFSVGFRSGVLEPFYSFLFFIPLSILGFRTVDIFLVYSITQIWAVLTHTEKIGKLGWLEYLFVTPSHHRVHHASNTRYLDKNLGTVFILWDKWLGTFQPELPAAEYEPIRYGITHPVKETLPNVITHEWKDIWKDVRRQDIGWKDRIWYIFGPPGWSHDGTRLTSNQLRRRENRNKRKFLDAGAKERMREAS